MKRFWTSIAAFLAAYKLTPVHAKETAEVPKKPLPFTDRYWYPTLLIESELQKIPISVSVSLIQQESGGNEKAIGASGEIGLMQLKDVVKIDYTRVTKRGANISNPLDNIRVGIWYLAWLRDTYKLSLRDSLLAYNSGIGNFLKGKIQSVSYADSILERANDYGLYA